MKTQSVYNTAAEPCFHFGNKIQVIRKRREKENGRYPTSWPGVHLQSKYQMTQYKTMKIWQKQKKIENDCISWIQDRVTRLP